MAGLLILKSVLKELNQINGALVRPKIVHRMLAPADDYTIKMDTDASWNATEEKYFLSNCFWIRKQPTLFKARVGCVDGVEEFPKDATTEIDARPHGSYEGEMFAALQGVVLFHRLKLYENYRKLTLQLDNEGVATDIYKSLSGLEVVSEVQSRKGQCNLIRDLLNECGVAADVVLVPRNYNKAADKLCFSGQVKGNFKFTRCSWFTGGDEVMGADKVFTDEELLKFKKKMAVTRTLKNLYVFPGRMRRQ